MMLINEFRILYCRKPFLLLSAVLLLSLLFSLFLMERNTDTYYYLYRQKTVYQEALKDPESSADYYQEMMDRKMNYFQEYHTFLYGMEERAQRIRENFQGSEREQAYQEKMLNRTLEDYEELYGIALSEADLTAFEKYVSSGISFIFELLFILILFYYGFAEEKDKGLYQLLRSGRFGREKLGGTKLSVFLSSAVAFTVISEISVLLFFSFLYGWSLPTAVVQSVTRFRNCAYSLTIGQMICFLVLIRMLTMMFLSAYIFGLGTFFHRTLGSVLGFFLFPGIEYLLWKATKNSGSLQGLHYVNLISLVSPKEALGEYTLLKIGNSPVNAFGMALLLTVVLLIFFAVAGICLFSFRDQTRQESKLERVLQKLRSVFRNVLGTSSIFLQELYKSLIQQKRILFLMLIIAYFISLLQTACSPQYFGTAGDAAYAYYTEKLQGILSEEQEQFLFKESERLQGLREEIAALKGNPSEENDGKILVLQSGLDLYEEGYQTVQTQLDLLKIKAEDGKKHWFINIRRYKELLSMSSDHIFSFAVAAICVMMLLSGLYSLDAKTGMETIITATGSGKKKVQKARLLFLVSAVFLVYLCISVPEYIRFYRVDQFRCISAGFSDFVTQSFPGNISIKALVCWVFLLRLVLLFLVGGATLILTKYFRNEAVPIVLMGGTILIISVFCLLFSMDLTTMILRLFGITFS